MSNIREAIDGYVKRVNERADHVRGKEQATKHSLIGPFFAMLGPICPTTTRTVRDFLVVEPAPVGR